jgi:hypothetical protein
MLKQVAGKTGVAEESVEVSADPADPADPGCSYGSHAGPL